MSDMVKVMREELCAVYRDMGKLHSEYGTKKATLEAENQRLLELLKPFAFVGASIDIDRLDEDNIATVEIAGAGSGRVFFFVRDILAAREALGVLS